VTLATAVTSTPVGLTVVSVDYVLAPVAGGTRHL
jgi:hypothetical protein